MPSAITHGVVGLVASWAFGPQKPPKYFWALAVACSALPDLDVVSFFIGLPYRHLLAHRGFFHSPFFALLLSLLVMRVFFHNLAIFSKPWLSLFFFFFLVSASHGLLDALNAGGFGVALLIPFDTSRYSFPWTPIPISPIRLRSFLTHWGWEVLKSEILWVWIPLFLAAVVGRKCRGLHFL